MDPVGIQSGRSWAPILHFWAKRAFFWAIFSCFPTGPNVVPKIRNLVPDLILTGSRLDPDWSKVVPKNKIGARLS